MNESSLHLPLTASLGISVLWHMLNSVLHFFFNIIFREQTVKNLIDAASCDFWSGYVLFTDVQQKDYGYIRPGFATRSSKLQVHQRHEFKGLKVKGLNLLSDYCKRWKLKINVSKTKIMIFRKSGQLPRNMAFVYDNEPLEIVSTMRYLGIVFTPGGSFSEAQTHWRGKHKKQFSKWINIYTNSPF